MQNGTEMKCTLRGHRSSVTKDKDSAAENSLLPLLCYLIVVSSGRLLNLPELKCPPCKMEVLGPTLQDSCKDEIAVYDVVIFYLY